MGVTIRDEAVHALRAKANEEIEARHIPSCQFALALEAKIVVTKRSGRRRPTRAT